MSRDLPARDVYAFIRSFTHQYDFAQFARSELQLTDAEINDIKADYPESKEQKYQMISRWKTKNGRRATIERLNEMGQKFHQTDDVKMEPHSTLSPEYDANSSLEASSIDSQGEGQNPRRGMPETTVFQGHQMLEETTNVHQPPLTDPLKAFTAEGSSVDTQVKTKAVGGQSGTTPQQPVGTRPETGVVTQQATIIGDGDAHPCNEVTSLSIALCESQKAQELMSLDNVYPITHTPKGYVLIINNHFKGKANERIGSERDVNNMYALWTGLGCKVRKENDLKAAEIHTKLNRIANSAALKGYDFLVIFIMSHGGMYEGTGVFMGDDDKPVAVKTILDQFNNDACKVPIPKLFFFQFCRGNKLDRGTNHPNEDLPLDGLFQSLNKLVVNIDDLDESDYASYPKCSDVLVSYATLPEYRAFRNKTGSWFINAIAHIFMRYAKDEHVTDMMIRVRSALKAKTGKTRDDNGQCTDCKEMSETRDLLTKKLYLLPGHDSFSYDPLDD